MIKLFGNRPNVNGFMLITLDGYNFICILIFSGSAETHGRDGWIGFLITFRTKTRPTLNIYFP